MNRDNKFNISPWEGPVQDVELEFTSLKSSDQLADLPLGTVLEVRIIARTTTAEERLEPDPPKPVAMPTRIPSEFEDGL